MPELMRLALKRRALTFYKSINATKLDWNTVQVAFREQFMSKSKKAEIGAELDSLHISTLREQNDSNLQALDNLSPHWTNYLWWLRTMTGKTSQRSDAYTVPSPKINGHTSPFVSCWSYTLTKRLYPSFQFNKWSLPIGETEKAEAQWHQSKNQQWKFIWPMKLMQGIFHDMEMLILLAISKFAVNFSTFTSKVRNKNQPSNIIFILLIKINSVTKWR